ncbi:hypothetical protein D3C76_523690 [compost metagenome]
MHHLPHAIQVALLQGRARLLDVLAHGPHEQHAHLRRNLDALIVLQRRCRLWRFDERQRDAVADPAQAVVQGAQAHRLDQPGIHAHRHAALPLLAHGVGGDADDRYARVALAQRTDQFVAVHLRHVHVGQEHVEGARRPVLQGFLAIRRDGRGAAQLFQLLLQQQLVDRVVFGDQHAQAEPGQSRRRFLLRRQHRLATLGEQQRLADPAQVVDAHPPALLARLRLVAAVVAGADPRAAPGGLDPRFRQQVEQHGSGGRRLRQLLDDHADRPPALDPGGETGRQLPGRRAHVDAALLQADAVERNLALLDHLQAQREAEAAAQADFADHAQGAVQHLAEVPADRQAQPGAGDGVLVAVDLVERLEQAPLLFLGNPDAGIGDLPLQLHLAIPAFQHLQAQHHPAEVGELQRIAQQVVENLPDPRRIAVEQARQPGIQAGVELQALALGHGGMSAHDLLGQLQRAEFHLLQRHLPGLDLRYVEDVADQLQQCRGRALDGAQVFLLLARQAGQAEQFQGAQHAVQRCADLVAHGRQEQRLGLAGRIRRAFRLDQCALCILVRGDVVERAEHHVLAVIAGRCEPGVQVALAEHRADIAAGFLRQLREVPVATQPGDLLRIAEPELGQAVLQQHLAGVAAQHAERDRRGMDHRAAEDFALDDLAVRLPGRQHHPPRVPVRGVPAAADAAEQRSEDAEQLPAGITEETLVVDPVDRHPAAVRQAAELHQHAPAGQAHAFIGALQQLRRAIYHLAARLHQGQFGEEALAEQPHEVVDPRHLQQGDGDQLARGTVLPPQLVRQVDADVAEQRLAVAVEGAGAPPVHAHVAARRRLLAQPFENAPDHFQVGVARQPAMARRAVQRRHGKAGVAGEVEQHRLRRRVGRGAPETAVVVGHHHPDGKRPARQLGRRRMFAGGQGERQGEGELAPLVDLQVALAHQQAALQRHRVLVALLGRRIALLGDAQQEAFMVADVAHQPAEVEADLVLFLLDHPCQRPIARADQQQRQGQGAQQDDVEAQRGARQFADRTVFRVHRRKNPGNAEQHWAPVLTVDVGERPGDRHRQARRPFSGAGPGVPPSATGRTTAAPPPRRSGSPGRGGSPGGAAWPVRRRFPRLRPPPPARCSGPGG